MIGLGTEISSVAEFNRRALCALRELDDRGDFITNIVRLLSSGKTPTKDQQRALYNVIRRNKKKISDRLVIDFAETHATGYSA